MDKGTAGVTPGANADQAAAIEREIEAIRGHLDGLVTELDHRRHRLNPIVAARRHPSTFALAGVLLAGAVTAAVLVHGARERRRHSWLGRGKQLKSSLADLMEGRAAAVSPKLGMRMLSALATAAAAVVGRRVATQIFSRSP